MENKNTWWSKLNVKNISKTFGVVVFVLVFVFTFLVTSSELKQHWVILLSVFGGVLALVIIAWVGLVLIVKKKKRDNDPNQQKIEQAIKSVQDTEQQPPLI
ncbi:MAG: hypothetical protein ACOQNY_00905 [Mycoplasmoidaceae bacterium]